MIPSHSSCIGPSRATAEPTRTYSPEKHHRTLSRSNMVTPEAQLDDYSVYSHLTDEELLQVAVERSLTVKRWTPDNPQDASSASPPSPVAPIQTSPNPSLRHPNPPRHLDYVPSTVPAPPDPPEVPAPANPPTGLSQFLYSAFKRQSSPLQTLIINGDAEALMDLVRRRSSSLTEPNDDGWLALHEAAYAGRIQCVRILVRAHPDSVNRCTSKSQTALLLAASRGNVSCVHFLLTHGADPNIANKERETPLFVACEQTNEAIVKLLLSFGAKVNAPCCQGGTPLDEACRHGCLTLCRTLLEAGAQIHTRNVYGIQPLFTAAQHGHADIVRLLAKHGADINGRAADGASSLYEACKNGHVAAAQALLDLKADANRATKSGLLPLHVAVQNNHIQIVSILISRTSQTQIQRAGISPLHIAAERDRNDIMELLIKAGFDVSVQLSRDRSLMYEDRRRTPLYFSVYNSNLEATEMLLEAGADPNLDLFNPLLIAVRLGWLEMAKLLLSYGADVNAQIPSLPSSFPSGILLSMEYLPMLKLLLDHGCNALPCFHCPCDPKPHSAIAPSRHPIEELQLSGEAPPQHCVQFCQAVSSLDPSQTPGPLVSLLLGYVGHVQLCSRLLERLQSRSDWTDVKLARTGSVEAVCDFWRRESYVITEITLKQQEVFVPRQIPNNDKVLISSVPPHPLMQLCRLKIRQLVGIRHLNLLNTLPLPAILISFLRYDVHNSLSF